MTALRLIAGALAGTSTRRTALIELMAADLIKYDAAQNEQDAIRCLMARGFSPFDVMLLVPEARMTAFQEIVAAEMVKP